jgi:hypothetical protein
VSENTEGSKRVIQWLLDEDQPAVRYLTLLELLEHSKTDPEVIEARSNIPRKGWARHILRLQRKAGHWESRKSLYEPKYTATNWRALVLSDLGLTAEHNRVKTVSNLFFHDWLDEKKENIFQDEICIVGNVARMLTRFGYEEDPRVKRLFDRIVDTQKEDGGWHCFESDVGSLDSWEGLAAFASLPKSKWTRRIRNSIDRGVEFYLERKLFDDGEKKYLPWFRFHYPNHYYYDVLVGLDVITKLGYADDNRLKPALTILREKKRADGSWVMDKIHPDIGSNANYRLREKPRPFALEEPGKPSKWITLTSLRIQKRVDEAS